MNVNTNRDNISCDSSDVIKHQLENMKESFLIAAAQNGNIEDIQSLIEYGVQINWKNANGTTCLIEATKKGHYHAMKLLLEYHADVNLLNSDGYAAIHICVKRNDIKGLDILLQQSNIIIDLKTKDGLTALDIAKQKKYNEIIHRLNAFSIELPQLVTLESKANTIQNTNPIINNKSSHILISPTISTSDTHDKTFIEHSLSSLNIAKLQIIASDYENMKNLYEKQIEEKKINEAKISSLSFTNQKLMTELNNCMELLQDVQKTCESVEIELSIYKDCNMDLLVEMTLFEVQTIEKKMKDSLKG